jgi:hypothetical protein
MHHPGRQTGCPLPHAQGPAGTKEEREKREDVRKEEWERRDGRNVEG